MEIRVDTLEEALKLLEEGVVTSWLLSPEAYYTIANQDPSRQYLRASSFEMHHDTLLGLPYIVRNA